MEEKDALDNSKNKANKNERQIVVPGEVVVVGDDYLPGDGVWRDGGEIVAGRYGLADVGDRLVKVIPLSGSYQPRRGNAIIGEVVDITFNGWLIDFGGAMNAFLPVSEVPRYVNKDELREQFDFGDVLFAKVWGAKARGIDLSVKMRGFGKLNGGMIVKINPNKVPRVIGKEGSMVNIIKDATGCQITVGQNGWVWVKGENVENELKVKKIIGYICENSFINGLTEKVEEFIKQGCGRKK